MASDLALPDGSARPVLLAVERSLIRVVEAGRGQRGVKILVAREPGDTQAGDAETRGNVCFAGNIPRVAGTPHAVLRDDDAVTAHEGASRGERRVGAAEPVAQYLVATAGPARSDDLDSGVR